MAKPKPLTEDEWAPLRVLTLGELFSQLSGFLTHMLGRPHREYELLLAVRDANLDALDAQVRRMDAQLRDLVDQLAARRHAKGEGSAVPESDESTRDEGTITYEPHTEQAALLDAMQAFILAELSEPDVFDTIAASPVQLKRLRQHDAFIAGELSRAEAEEWQP